MNARSSQSTWFVLATAGVLYFAEGLPYGLVNDLFPLYMRTHGATLTEIGMLSAIGLVWTLKIFWAPLVDRVGTYRAWMSGALVAILATMVAFAVSGASTGAPLWILLTILVFASATQDIAVDAYTIALTPADLLGPVNSVRVTTYRIAMILAGGGFAIVATAMGWRTVFLGAALLVVVLVGFSRSIPVLQRVSVERVTVIDGIRRWLNRPNAMAFVLLVLLYRLGDSALMPMIRPFWIDHGFTAAEVGSVTTGAGILLTVAGAWVGGWFVSRAGMFRALLWLGVAQAGSNVGYALVATMGAGRPGFYSAAVVENFCGGLGTAAYLTLLMRLCDKRFAATEYALLSALYVLTRSIAGSASGILATSMGYAGFFWLTVALGAPALVLLWRRRDIFRLAFEEGGA